MNTTLACHFSRNTWTRERGYPSIKTNIQISIWYNEDRKKLFDKIPPITIADSKKKKRERKRSFNFLSEIWNFDAAVPEHQLRRRAERHSRWNLLARIDSAQPLFPIRGKWEATSWWYTVTKSHQSSLGLPKRYRIGRQLRANLSIYPSTKLSLGYQSFRWYIYISILLSLKPSHLSLSLYMRFFLSGGHVYLLDPVPRLYRRRYLFERRPGRRQPSGTSNEHFWVVWRERRARYRSWGSQLDEIRTITSFLPSLKEPWNWKGSLSPSVTEKKEGGCPFSPTIGEIKGARAVSRESGLYYEREYAYVRLVFYPRRISSTIYPKLLIYIISFKLFFKLIRNQAYLFIL